MSLRIVLFFIAIFSYGESSFRTNPISKEYDEGSYLLYNCSKGYFACVAYSNILECEKKRKSAIRKNKFNNLSCAPLKKLKTHKECVREQYLRIHRSQKHSYCKSSLEN